MNAQVRLVLPVEGSSHSTTTNPWRRLRGDVSLLQLLHQGGVTLGLILASYLFFTHFVVQTVLICGNSMAPTLRDKDYYLVNRLAGWLRAPHRGDIVVLKDPTDHTPVVKRVVGVEGDTVELRDGFVYLNGHRIEEPYLDHGTRTYPFTSLCQVVRCGPGEFFVLGDNRFYSQDSRSYGAIPRSAILGFLVR